MGSRIKGFILTRTCVMPGCPYSHSPHVVYSGKAEFAAYRSGLGMRAVSLSPTEGSPTPSSHKCNFYGSISYSGGSDD